MDNAVNLTADLAIRGTIVYSTPSFLRSCASSYSHFLSHRAYHTSPVLFVVSSIYTTGPWTIVRICYAQKSSKGFHCLKKSVLYDHSPTLFYIQRVHPLLFNLGGHDYLAARPIYESEGSNGGVPPHRTCCDRYDFHGKIQPPYPVLRIQRLNLAHSRH